MTAADQKNAIAAEIDQLSGDLARLAHRMTTAANVADRDAWIQDLNDFTDMVERLRMATEGIGNPVEVSRQLGHYSTLQYGTHSDMPESIGRAA